MDRHIVLLLLVLAWAVPPAVTLFFVARSQRRHRGQLGDRDSLDAMHRPIVIAMLALYWLLCLGTSLALFLILD